MKKAMKLAAWMGMGMLSSAMLAQSGDAVKNEEANLPACLESVANLVDEIILIDNNSADETAAAVAREFPTVQLLHNPANLGFSKACNRAAKMAQGRYLCFLNSDTLNAGKAIDVVGFKIYAV